MIQRLLEVGEPVTSDLAVIEARRDIAMKWPACVDALEAILTEVKVIPPVVFDLPVELIDKDRPILCSAIRGQCQFLATCDRTHYGHLYDHTVKGVTVVSLKRLAHILLEE